ncbi:MAG: ABC transporter permease [Christensenellales bacterium]
MLSGPLHHLILVQDRTRFGRYLFAIGGNEEGARLSGVSTKFWKVMVYVFAGLMTGLAAVILTSRLEVADPIVGKKWEFEAICCSILGGTSMNIGKGDVKGTILGVALLTVIRSGMNVIRIPVDGNRLSLRYPDPLDRVPGPGIHEGGTRMKKKINTALPALSRMGVLLLIIVMVSSSTHRF